MGVVHFLYEMERWTVERLLVGAAVKIMVCGLLFDDVYYCSKDNF